MSEMICPHCTSDNAKMKDPSDLPWVEDAEPETKCSMCGKMFWVSTISTIHWETYPTEEEYDNR